MTKMRGLYCSVTEPEPVSGPGLDTEDIVVAGFAVFGILFWAVLVLYLFL